MRSYEFKRYLSSLKDTGQKEIYFYRLKYIFARKIDSFLKVQKGAQSASGNKTSIFHETYPDISSREKKRKKKKKEQWNKMIFLIIPKMGFNLQK